MSVTKVSAYRSSLSDFNFSEELNALAFERGYIHEELLLCDPDRFSSGDEVETVIDSLQKVENLSKKEIVRRCYYNPDNKDWNMVLVNDGDVFTTASGEQVKVSGLDLGNVHWIILKVRGLYVSCCSNGVYKESGIIHRQLTKKGGVDLPKDFLLYTPLSHLL